MESSDTWDYFPLGDIETQNELDRRLVERRAEKRPTTYKLG